MDGELNKVIHLTNAQCLTNLSNIFLALSLFKKEQPTMTANTTWGYFGASMNQMLLIDLYDYMVKRSLDN